MDYKAFFSNDRFAAEAGIVLDEISAGKATTRLTVEDRHLNAGDVVQGGAIFTMADLTMAAAANAHGVLAFTVQSDIRFLESAVKGDVLTATAQEKLLKRNIAHYQVEVVNQDGKLIALFDGICYRKRSKE